MVHLTIDGKKIEAMEGSTILDTAEKAGIHIPNLCYLKGMKGIGACRLCMVEIEGLKAPVTACTTKVKDGMSIKTSTPEIEELRGFVIDLVLSMHPMDCMTCAKAGVCRLQEYAYKYNVKESSYTRKKWDFQIDDKNPFIRREPDYCVLCSRCVRVCKDQGTKILDFMGRGVGSKVTTANDKPLHETPCTFCGSCIDVCPVNAITEAVKGEKGREWELQRTDSVCTNCGCSCSIRISTKNNKIVKVTTKSPTYKHNAYTCVYGRYGFDFVNSKDRITAPLVRKDGKLVEATWEDASKAIATALKSSKDKTAFYTNGALLAEDAIALDRFASDVLKTTNVGSTVGLYADSEALITGVSDLREADLIIAVDLNVSQGEYIMPAIDAIIRRTAASGMPVISMGSTSFGDIASASISGSGVDAIKSLISYLCKEGLCTDKSIMKEIEGAVVSEDTEKAGKLFIGAKRPIVITTPAIAGAASNITLIKGSLISIPFEANAIGLALVGIVGSPAYTERVSKGKDLKALYVIGETTIKARPEGVPFVVVHTTHLDALANDADVVLPLTTLYESEGSVIVQGLALKAVNRSIDPIGDAKMPREAFDLIAEAMGVDLKMPKDTDIKKLLKIKTEQKVSPFKSREGFENMPLAIFRDVNRSMLSTERFKWLVERNR